MRNRYFHFIFAGLMLGVAAPLFAQGGNQLSVLTEEESVRLGLSRPEITNLFESTISEAQGEVRQAGRWPNPTLDYLQEKTPTLPGNSTERTYQLSQQIDLAGKLGLNRQAAEERLAATEADVDARRLETTAEIRRRFYDVLYRQDLLKATRDWDARMATIAATVGKLNKGGEVAGYDRRRITLERAGAQARLRIEQAQYDKAWQQLAAMLGDTLPPATVQGELLPPEPLPLAALLVRIDQQPQLRSLNRRAGAFDLDRKAAARAWIPDLTVGIGRKTVDNGAASDSGSVVNLSIQLPLFDHGDPRKQRAAAQASIARSEALLLRARLEGSLRGLWQQTMQMIAAARDYRTEAFDSSLDLTRIAEASYRGGETGILELLDAYRASLDAQSRALELAWEARQAAIELNTFAGNDKP